MALPLLVLLLAALPAAAQQPPPKDPLAKATDLLRAVLEPLRQAPAGTCRGAWSCESFDEDELRDTAPPDPVARHEGAWVAAWRDAITLTERDGIRTLERGATVLIERQQRWVAPDNLAGCLLTTPRLARHLLACAATRQEPITFADRPALRISTSLSPKDLAALLDGMDVDAMHVTRSLEILQNIATADARKGSKNAQADVVATIDPATRTLLHVRLRLLCLSDEPTEPDRRADDPIRFVEGLPEPLQRPWLTFLVELQPHDEKVAWPTIDDALRARLGG